MKVKPPVLKLLPLRPPPQNDELYSSWLIRLARANGTTLPHLYRTLSSNDPSFEKDLDRKLRLHVAIQLHERTGVSMERLGQMTLEPLKEALGQENSAHAGRRWVLPLKFEFRRVAAYGLHCCPDCLAEGPVPYYRRAWRLALMTVCPRHQRLLLNRCPACERPIHHRGTPAAGLGPDSVPESLASCGWCGLDFRTLSLGQYDQADVVEERGDYHHGRRHPRSRSTLTRATRRVGYFQEGILDAVFCGTYSLNGVLLPTRDFLNGLHQLTRLLTHLPGAEKWRRALHECSDGLPLCGLEQGQGLASFESLDVGERHRIMISLVWLLNDWPHRFHEVSKRAGIARYQLLRGVYPVPAWLVQEAAHYGRMDEYAHLLPYVGTGKRDKSFDSK